MEYKQTVELKDIILLDKVLEGCELSLKRLEKRWPTKDDGRDFRTLRLVSFKLGEENIV